KFLSINNNQIQGFYSNNDQTLKIKSTQENYGKIFDYLKAKNITFFDDVCSDTINENCRITSNQDFEGYQISIEDEAIYIHKKPLNRNILDTDFSLEKDVMVKANVAFENNPFEIKLTNKDSNFGLELSIQIENQELIDAIEAKNSNLNFEQFINSKSIAFYENKGFKKDINKKLESRRTKMVSEFCYVIEQDCKDIKNNIKINNNLYNFAENSKLLELITEKDSAMIIDISDDLSMNYNFIFKDSASSREEIRPEIKELLKTLGFKRTSNIDLKTDTYEIQGSIQDVLKALSNEEENETDIDLSNTSTAITLIPADKNNSAEEDSISYLNLNEENGNLHISISSNKDYKIQSQEITERNSGLSYFEINTKPYLDLLGENTENANPLAIMFGSFFKDIKISGDAQFIDNKIVSETNLIIPQTTLDLLLGFISPTQTLENEIYGDIKEEDWFSKPIKELDKEIFISAILETQYNEETFKANFEPNKDISRKEFIMLITELLFKDDISKLKTKHEQQLKDQEEDIETLVIIGKEEMFSDFENYQNKGFYHVQVAKEIGLVKGDAGKNTLRPDDSLSRAEAVTLLARGFDSLKNSQADEFEIEFKDVPQDAWYMQNLKKAVKNEIVKGTSPTTFSPTDKLNRAQAITLINRLNKQVLKFY
ncbi:S-layer homology domain-containing protein, partial [bacterium]|nr:S-layer homology domain-containing protein [bacterium]